MNRLTASAGSLPNGLSVVDWRQIRAEYERHRHTAFPEGSGHRARIREQQFVARFDGRGVQIVPDSGAWTWGLEFAGSGRPRMKVDKNRVSYAWAGGIEEWYVNDPRGANHGVTSGATPIGSPYVETGPVGAGASITVTVEFTRTGTQPITCTPRLLGEGIR